MGKREILDLRRKLAENQKTNEFEKIKISKKQAETTLSRIYECEVKIKSGSE